MSDFVNWNEGTEEILKAILRELEDVFENTDYAIRRNPASREKHINIYRKGEIKRWGYIKPCVREQRVRFTFPAEKLSSVNLAVELKPENEVVNKKTPGFARFKMSVADARKVCEFIVSD